MLYKGVKSINNAAHPPEGGPAEVGGGGGFRPQFCLRWSMQCLTRMPDGGDKANCKLIHSALSPEQGPIFVTASLHTGQHKVNDSKIDFSGD